MWRSRCCGRRASPAGIVLDGYSPWVTGAAACRLRRRGRHADGRRRRRRPSNCSPSCRPTCRAFAPSRRRGSSACRRATPGSSRCERRASTSEWLLAGPVENVMSLGAGRRHGRAADLDARAGAHAARRSTFCAAKRSARPDLRAPLDALRSRLRSELEAALLAAVRGEPRCSNDDLRQRANSLVLRATQAALAAAKGAGYVAGHPAGRWCREALFFLVWSCPQPVLAAQSVRAGGNLGLNARMADMNDRMTGSADEQDESSCAMIHPVDPVDPVILSVVIRRNDSHVQ